MIKISKEKHGSQNSIIMKFKEDVIRIVLAELKQGILTYSKKLVFPIIQLLVSPLPAKRITEDKCNQNKIKEDELVASKIWKKCKSHHINKVLVLWLSCLAEKACSKWWKWVHSINLFLKFFHFENFLILYTVILYL